MSTVFENVDPSVVALIPSREGFSLHEYQPLIRSMEEAIYYQENGVISETKRLLPTVTAKNDILSVAAVVWDEEVNSDTVELLSNGPPVSMSIPCSVSLPYLCVQLKDIGRFTSITMLLHDDKGECKTLVASNKQAVIRVSDNICSLPLNMVPGWNLLRFDMKEIMNAAFDTNFARCSMVTIHASCRVVRVYFEKRHYEDSELPPWLQTLRAVHEAVERAHENEQLLKGQKHQRIQQQMFEQLRYD